MTDETPPPEPQPAPLYHYRVFLIGGTPIDVVSPNEFDKFFRYVKADGFIWAPGAGIPWHAIACIIPLNTQGMSATQNAGMVGGSVIPFRPVA